MGRGDSNESSHVCVLTVVNNTFAWGLRRSSGWLDTGSSETAVYLHLWLLLHALKTALVVEKDGVLVLHHRYKIWDLITLNMLLHELVSMRGFDNALSDSIRHCNVRLADCFEFQGGCQPSVAHAEKCSASNESTFADRTVNIGKACDIGQPHLPIEARLTGSVALDKDSFVDGMLSNEHFPIVLRGVKHILNRLEHIDDCWWKWIDLCHPVGGTDHGIN